MNFLCKKMKWPLGSIILSLRIITSAPTSSSPPSLLLFAPILNQTSDLLRRRRSLLRRGRRFRPVGGLKCRHLCSSPGTRQRSNLSHLIQRSWSGNQRWLILATRRLWGRNLGLRRWQGGSWWRW